MNAAGYVVLPVLKPDDAAFFRVACREGARGQTWNGHLELGHHSKLAILAMRPALDPILRWELGPEYRHYTDCYHVNVPDAPMNGIGPWLAHVDTLDPHWSGSIYDPAAPKVIRCWAFPQRVTLDNGPIRVWPGSHLSQEKPEGPGVPITCEAGEAIVCHPALWHAQDPNRDSEARIMVRVEWQA